MRVHLPQSAPRVAFLGAPTFALHVPLAADWAEVRFFPVTGEGWAEAVSAARAWAPAVCILFEPQALTAEQLAQLPGLKVGVLPQPMPSRALEALAARCHPQRPDGLRWVTTVEHPQAAGGAGLPLLQVLPLPVDMRRFEQGPRFERRGVLVPGWARPAPEVLAQVQGLCSVELLPENADVEETLAHLERAGVLLYSTRDLLGRLDPLPLLALAGGLLLVSETPFPADWYIEPEDDFLVRPADMLAAAVDELQRMPEVYKAVRIRAWQKMREAFDASSAFKRLVHDAQLFADVEGHLVRLGADAQAKPPAGDTPAKVTRRASRKVAGRP